jgi:starch phosphorylase
MPTDIRFRELPSSLAFLGELATNLWWSWNASAQDLLAGISAAPVARPFNPVALLLDASPERLAELSKSKAYLDQLAAVKAEFEAYMAEPNTWYNKVGRPLGNGVIAYFSAEFGFVDALPTYSGGLGILAGDHTKSASDLGLPFLGVSLLYRCGYVEQQIDVAGWQQDAFPEHSFDRLPVVRVLNADGRPLCLDIPLIDRHVRVRVWAMRVGRATVYALDSDDPANDIDDRMITRTLYDADMDVRIRQEILLGMGGVRLMRALGHEVAAYHMNEGHAAFLGLERIREEMAAGLDFEAARKKVAQQGVFTTHTPIEAGHDKFGTDQIARYFGHFAKSLGIPMEAILQTGWAPGASHAQPFNMTYLAVRTSRACNGVSRLHAEVSRHLLQPIWPQMPVHSIPVTSVTNGVHAESWIGHEMKALFAEVIGPDWSNRICDPSAWNAVLGLAAKPLWDAHCETKRRLVRAVREREAARRERLGMPASEIEAAWLLLSEDAFTIGFARRFAPYKRATLILEDTERLVRMVGSAERPVQILFAGKSHPRNEFGKKLIQAVYKASQSPELRGRVVLLENYDIELGHLLTQGSDIWLNNPRKPQEASGTSGMKAAMNGVLNCSILDD